MPVRKYKPTSACQRISSVESFDDVTSMRPNKRLTSAKKSQAGRSLGKISVRHRGGGAKRRVRLVDFKRLRFDIPANVITIEYDPNRGARLALLHYVDGHHAYMLAPEGLKVGDRVVSSKTRGDVRSGNRFPLDQMPVGIEIHDIELLPGRGGQLVHGAGGVAQLMAVEGPYATVKLPSGEIRRVSKICMATIGKVSNPDYRLVRWGKAGRMRHRGFRPTVRGKAMNPVDHPHGGGEGHNPIGLPHPKTPWGKAAL